MALRALALTLLPAAALAGEVVLATFDGTTGLTHKWVQSNDPIMGGRSTGSFTEAGSLGIFDGHVVDVPALKAPGFIKVDTTDSRPFPDISSCKAISVNAKATTHFAGYRLSLGNAHAPGGKFFAYGYKAQFQPSVGKFGTVDIPIESFTDFWDDATGNPVKTCQDDKIYCPDEKTLQNLGTISVWAEGVAGKVHLEIKSISATGCDGADFYA